MIYPRASAPCASWRTGGYLTALTVVDRETLREALLDVRLAYGEALNRAQHARGFVCQRYSEEAIGQRVAKLVHYAYDGLSTKTHVDHDYS